MGYKTSRANVTFTKQQNGVVVKTRFVKRRLGWVGWMDITPPTFASDNAVYERTKLVKTLILIPKYQDASGAKTMRNQGANVSYN